MGRGQVRKSKKTKKSQKKMYIPRRSNVRSPCLSLPQTLGNHQLTRKRTGNFNRCAMMDFVKMGWVEAPYKLG